MTQQQDEQAKDSSVKRQPSPTPEQLALYQAAVDAALSKTFEFENNPNFN
jgi:hypothetical protein